MILRLKKDYYYNKFLNDKIMNVYKKSLNLEVWWFQVLLDSNSLCSILYVFNRNDIQISLEDQQYLLKLNIKFLIIWLFYFYINISFKFISLNGMVLMFVDIIYCQFDS